MGKLNLFAKVPPPAKRNRWGESVLTSHTCPVAMGDAFNDATRPIDAEAPYAAISGLEITDISTDNWVSKTLYR